MMAFWIGRSLVDDAEALALIKLVAWLGVFAAIYGIYQTFSHFPSWDQTWINSAGYTALNVGGGVVRAFGMSASAQEYGAFLALSIVAWLAISFRSVGSMRMVAVIAIGLESYALYYEAQRTILFLTVFAVGVTVAARFRVRPLGVGLCGILAMVGLVFFAGKFTSGGSAVCHQGDQACVLSQRANSVANPTGQGSSLSGHLTETRKGMASALTRPLGYGVGAATLAAGRFNTQRAARGTEFDPGNAGTSLGIVGLGLYPFLVVLAFRAAYRVAMRRRDLISLFCIGAMSVDLMQWMNGDLYSVTWLVWLFVGWAEAQSMKPDEELEILGAPEEFVHPSSARLTVDQESTVVRPHRRTRWA
jgi:hypothetical protein